MATVFPNITDVFTASGVSVHVAVCIKASQIERADLESNLESPFRRFASEG